MEHLPECSLSASHLLHHFRPRPPERVQQRRKTPTISCPLRPAQISLFKVIFLLVRRPREVCVEFCLWKGQDLLRFCIFVERTDLLWEDVLTVLGRFSRRVEKKAGKTIHTANLLVGCCHLRWNAGKLGTGQRKHQTRKGRGKKENKVS